MIITARNYEYNTKYKKNKQTSEWVIINQKSVFCWNTRSSAVSCACVSRLGYVEWTSRMPAPTGFPLWLRCCRFPHHVQKVRGLPQRTGGIHQSLRSLRIWRLPAGSARYLLLRKHKVGKKWQWQADSTLSCERLFAHKIRWSWQNRRARHKFCFRWELHSWFPQSGSWLPSLGLRTPPLSGLKMNRSDTSSELQEEKKEVSVNGLKFSSWGLL